MIANAQHRRYQFSDRIYNIDEDIVNAISSGLDILGKLQKPDGSFVATQIMGDGKKKEISSPFVTALILSALANVQLINSPSIRPAIIKASHFLHSQIDPDGFVCFFGKDSPYPRDTDDTAMVWYSLLRSNFFPEFEFDLKSLETQFAEMYGEDGSVRIWKDREHHVDNDFVVTCNVYRFWKFVFRTEKYRTKKLLQNFFETDEWKQGSPYYGNPYVALAVAVGTDGTILNLMPQRTRVEMIDDLKSALFQASIDESLIPFIIFTLAKLVKIDLLTVRLLLETQDQSGSWSCAPLFKHVNRYCYYKSIAVSTAFAVVALERIKKMIGGQIDNET